MDTLLKTLYEEELAKLGARSPVATTAQMECAMRAARVRFEGLGEFTEPILKEEEDAVRQQETEVQEQAAGAEGEVAEEEIPEEE